MRITCFTDRIIHSNENFQLVGCMPMGDYDDSLVLNSKYHNFTVKDTNHRLRERKQYTIDVTELPPTKWGVQYLLEDIPSLSFDSIDAITDDLELDLLREIMNDQQANYVHRAYPNFIRLVLMGKAEEINVKNIYNVSHKRLAQYVRKIDKHYNTFLLHARSKHYNLSSQECRTLLSSFETVNECTDEMTLNPYYCLIDLCGRSFRYADADILNHDDSFRYSDMRIEYMLDYAIQRFEMDGSTYVDAMRIGDYLITLDNDPAVLQRVVDVARSSERIHYEPDKNILQRQVTYDDEMHIAKFFKQILDNNIQLDWDWTKYTKIKDGELTDEQKQLLKTFCEHRIVLLDAPSGTGKTSSLMALLDMIEDHDMTYKMMSPTGKAASRLSEQTGRPASTIHRAVLSGTLEDYEVIIIDESSMLSVTLLNMVIMNDLYSQVRFVLVGDSAQIPSIGLGRVFKDMGQSNIIPMCTLTKCFRFDEGGASYISTLTRQGKYYLTEEQEQMERFTIGEKSDYEFIRFNGDVEQIVDVYMELIDKGVDKRDIMLLIPYNIGSYGATKLNNLIQERINPIGDDMFLKTKHNDTYVCIHKGNLVMNIKNNYSAVTLQHYNDISWDDSFGLEDAEHISVFNGQTGVVVDVVKDSTIINGKMLIANIEGEDIIYTQGDANNLLLASASNPFKFQGSQCKYIINVIIRPHSRMWNRNLLYTAQTRMTDKLIEIGDIDVIKEAVETAGDDNRNTRLKEFITML